LNLSIRKASINDIEELQSIAKQTFSETFSSGNTEENLRKYLEEGFSKEKLTAELTDSNSEFYFALSSNQVIGYLKVNSGPAQTELKDQRAMEIERIYVLNEFHGKKAGQALFEKALQLAGQKNAAYLWLGVWEENTRAIKFYRKNGFEEFDRHIFILGNDEQTDIMMKREVGSRKTEDGSRKTGA
jgi:diamine N-acetyltransferase